MSPKREQDAARFLTKIARALHVYGTPSHRLERALEQMSGSLGLEAQWLVTPTSIVASLGPFERSHTYLVRVDTGESNLAKLTDLNDVVRDLFAGSMTLEEASRRVDSIVSAEDTHGALVTIASFGVVSAAASIFFGGGPQELMISALIGVLIAVLLRAAAGRPRLSLVVPALAALLSSMIAHSAAALPSGLYPFIPMLAGLIVLIPGLTLTIAVNELAHRHLVSGSSRLVGALVTFLQIGFGVALGTRLAGALMPGTIATSPEPFGWPFVVLGLLVTAVALDVLFRARSRDLGVILIACVIGFGGSRLASDWLGPELGALLGAFGLGIVGNLISRRLDVPAATPLLPGMLLLVPGSLGFRSLSALIEQDVVGGLQSGFSMILIAFSIVTGLLLANLVSRPRNLF